MELSEAETLALNFLRSVPDEANRLVKKGTTQIHINEIAGYFRRLSLRLDVDLVKRKGTISDAEIILKVEE
jgi:hypothetical protein